MNRYHLLAFVGGVIVATHLLRAAESSCCERVGYGVRDKLTGYAGPLAPVASKLFDGLGLTKLAPSLLDLFGVPKDA
jgi:hypothetical protein